MNGMEMKHRDRCKGFLGRWVAVGDCWEVKARCQLRWHLRHLAAGILKLQDQRAPRFSGWTRKLRISISLSLRRTWRINLHVQEFLKWIFLALLVVKDIEGKVKGETIREDEKVNVLNKVNNEMNWIRQAGNRFLQGRPQRHLQTARPKMRPKSPLVELNFQMDRRRLTRWRRSYAAAIASSAAYAFWGVRGAQWSGGQQVAWPTSSSCWCSTRWRRSARLLEQQKRWNPTSTWSWSGKGSMTWARTQGTSRSFDYAKGTWSRTFGCIWSSTISTSGTSKCWSGGAQWNLRQACNDINMRDWVQVNSGNPFIFTNKDLP